MFSAIADLFAFLDRGTRIRFGLLLLPMLASSLLDMLSIGLVVPLIQVLTGASAADALMRRLIPLVGVLDRASFGTLVVTAFLVGFLVKNIALYLLANLINRSVNDSSARYTTELFALYLGRPYHTFLTGNSSVLIRNLYSSVPRAFESARLALGILMDGILVLATLGLLMAVQPRVTLVMAGIMAAATLVFIRLISPYNHRWGLRMHAVEAATIQWMNQAFASIKEVQVLDRREFLRDNFAGMVTEYARYRTLGMGAGQLSRLYTETIAVVGFTAVLLVLLSSDQPLDGMLTQLGLFGLAALRLIPSLNRILQQASDLKRWGAAVSALRQDWSSGLAAQLPSASGRPVRMERDLVLDRVCYTYPNAETAALSKISLTVWRGMRLGIVGPSGSGKTTLMDILLGLLAPQSGVIRVDGEDIAARMADWRSTVGYVPQSIHLVDDTLRRNVAFGLYDDAIDDPAVRRALDMVGLTALVEGLPDGLDTRLGENGNRLSGGQRQRVGIARALYGNPDILVFDEATSALDAEAEAEINRVVEELAGRKTILIIAHRLSSVRHCDALAFLSAGRIVDMGRFEDLVERVAQFRAMVEMSDLSSSADSRQ